MRKATRPDPFDTLVEDYPGQSISGPDHDTRDREGEPAALLVVDVFALVCQYTDVDARPYTSYHETRAEAETARAEWIEHETRFADGATYTTRINRYRLVGPDVDGGAL